MSATGQSFAFDYAGAGDAELVRLAQAGDRDAFRAIMQRCNQRLFRVARAVVGEDSEAEDVVQEAYTRAFASLDGFRGEAAILTWLTRITLNEAHDRLRRRRPTVELETVDQPARAGHILLFPKAAASPEADASRAEIRRLLERAVDELPEAFRVVFIMREVDDCSIEETASALGIPRATVKTRLHRAKRQLRRVLDEHLASALSEAFPFLGARCERITEQILARLPVQTAASGEVFG